MILITVYLYDFNKYILYDIIHIIYNTWHIVYMTRVWACVYIKLTLRKTFETVLVNSLLGFLSLVSRENLWLKQAQCCLLSEVRLVVNANGGLGFSGGSVVKNPPANAGDVGLIPDPERSPGGEHGNPLQYSCQKKKWTKEPGGLQSIGIAKSQHDWSN